MCLSLVMIIILIVRVSKMYGPVGVDLVWEVFWQYAEGAVAVLMGSMTTFRALLVGQGSRNSEQRQLRPSNSWIARMMLKKGSAQSDQFEEGNKLPAIPHATLTGLKSLIRRNNRSAGATTMMQSEIGPLPEEADDYRMYGTPDKAGQQGVHVKHEWQVQYSVRQPSKKMGGAEASIGSLLNAMLT